MIFILTSNQESYWWDLLGFSHMFVYNTLVVEEVSLEHCVDIIPKPDQQLLPADVPASCTVSSRHKSSKRHQPRSFQVRLFLSYPGAETAQLLVVQPGRDCEDRVLEAALKMAKLETFWANPQP